MVSPKKVMAKKPSKKEKSVRPSLQDQIDALKDDIRIKFAFLNNRDNIHEKNYRETNKRFEEHENSGKHVIRTNPDNHMKLSEDA